MADFSWWIIGHFLWFTKNLRVMRWWHRRKLRRLVSLTIPHLILLLEPDDLAKIGFAEVEEGHNTSMKIRVI